MKVTQPQCEVEGHDIQLTMLECPSPYIGVRCNCQTCGKEWLENYQRVFVSDGIEKKTETPQPQLELI